MILTSRQRVVDYGEAEACNVSPGIFRTIEAGPFCRKIVAMGLTLQRKPSQLPLLCLCPPLSLESAPDFSFGPPVSLRLYFV